MKLSKVQFDSMAFQERNGTCGTKPERSERNLMAFQEQNGTCGMEPERFGRNLAEKSRTDRDLK